MLCFVVVVVFFSIVTFQLTAIIITKIVLFIYNIKSLNHLIRPRKRDSKRERERKKRKKNRVLLEKKKLILYNNWIIIKK